MSDIPAFTGYPKEATQFLADIRANNDRDWFNAHKDIYLEAIVAPTQAFVLALGERLRELAPDIEFDTRTNGSGSMMRIYRDIRFSKDKSPYKDWVGIRFWQGAKKMGHGFHMGLSPDGAGVHVGAHGFDKAGLAAYRAAVDDKKLGPELVAAIETVKASGPYRIEGENYKRVPRGYAADHPRAELLRYAGLWANSPTIAKSKTTTARFVDICFDHCRNMYAIQAWLRRALG